MVSYSQTDMKIPVRPAPAPPTSRPNRHIQRSSSFFDNWDDGNDPFSNGNISQSFSSQQFDHAQAIKKKPPPRPPPPKINNQHSHNFKKNKTNVLAGLFSRSNQNSHSSSNSRSNQQSQKQVVTKDRNIVVASLIDFDSPSSSPTFTTRSSSDGVSVNSFGSDGSASNNGYTPSGGTASLFESGFEDDFDFFGNHAKIISGDQKDPWSVVSQDPFSPPKTKQDKIVLKSQDVSCNNISERRNLNSNSVGVLKPPPVNSTMPTIIRAKTNKPCAPSRVHVNTKDTFQALPGTLGCPASIKEANLSHSSEVSSLSSADSSREWSPPMPSVPPPPPPDNLDPDDVPIILPDLPPRKSSMNNKTIPHGIALFDYSSSHPDDLNFKINDVIHILKKINSEWLYGEKGNQRGMFPANFIEVIVPINDKDRACAEVQTVTALYPFTAQQWDDLDFPAGAVIEVLGQINQDWLYGEYQGKRGQFPSTFVDHVPSGLPQQKP